LTHLLIFFFQLPNVIGLTLEAIQALIYCFRVSWQTNVEVAIVEENAPIEENLGGGRSGDNNSAGGFIELVEQGVRLIEVAEGGSSDSKGGVSGTLLLSFN
jgi:hypothetical protein